MVKCSILPGREYNPGDKRPVSKEEPLQEIQFTIHKFTNRPRPHRKNVAIFPHFAEFGSEIISTLYLLPMHLNGRYQGKYSIVLGWHGRAFLYRHLVDEYWELKEEHQWLREYCRAFHHSSKNLKRAEKKAAAYGTFVDLNEYAYLALYPRLSCCQDKGCGGGIVYTDTHQVCLRCQKMYHRVGIYHEIANIKEKAVFPPASSFEKQILVNKYLKPNSVGITARNRICYGRNLPVDFYEKLIHRLEAMGYNPIWIGEKDTTLRCSVPHIIDYCLTEEAKDLEATLALVAKLKFTVQFWTASTRLAGLVGTPYLLFESPDQIWGMGQEGIRMNLCTKGDKRKLVISHYVSVMENQSGALDLVEKAVREMEVNNFQDIIGLVEDEGVIQHLRKENTVRIGNL